MAQVPERKRVSGVRFQQRTECRAGLNAGRIQASAEARPIFGDSVSISRHLTPDTRRLKHYNQYRIVKLKRTG